MNAFYCRNNHQRLKMMVMAMITVIPRIYIHDDDDDDDDDDDVTL